MHITIPEIEFISDTDSLNASRRLTVTVTVPAKCSDCKKIFVQGEVARQLTSEDWPISSSEIRDELVNRLLKAPRYCSHCAKVDPITSKNRKTLSSLLDKSPLADEILRLQAVAA